MGNLTTFQLSLLIGFAAAAFVGAVLFALGVGPDKKNEIGSVVMWGTLPHDAVDKVLGNLRVEDDRFATVSYVEMDPRTYDREFVDALAAGRGPDLFIISEEDLFLHRDKLIPIPFDTFSERQFRDSFVEVGEVFLGSTGVLGLPLVVDPLVMYWNRDIFADVAIAEPPRYWDEFFTMSPRVTQRDQSDGIVRSFAAFGEYRNVNHAKDILAGLVLQTGNPIVFRSESGEVRSVLASTINQATPPTEAALRFYTEFSNPSKAVYSWNRALPEARQSFLSEDLALYVGFASELGALRLANPNLNFDVTAMPQSRDADRRVTFGHVLALALPRGSSNPSGALEVAFALTSSVWANELAGYMSLPPVRRNLLSVTPQDPSQVVFYESAIAARSWLDPRDAETDGVFQRMIESYLSGRLRLHEAVQAADEELGQLLGS